MHRLYCVLKDRHSPPTPDEVAYATGQKKLDGHTEAKLSPTRGTRLKADFVRCL